MIETKTRDKYNSSSYAESVMDSLGYDYNLDEIDDEKFFKLQDQLADFILKKIINEVI